MSKVVTGSQHMDDTKTISELVRDARCEKAMTQSRLAEAVGCRQSAISMFEGGRVDALSQKTLAAIAEQLGLDLKVVSAMDERAVTARSLVLKFCPIDACPSNIPFTVRGKLHYSPTMVEAIAAEHTRCSVCGDVLEDRCPNAECRAEINEGAFCQHCGAAYVQVTSEGREDAEQWAASERARISEVRAMSRTKHFVRRTGMPASPGVGNNVKK